MILNGVELKNINDKKLRKTPINKNVQIKSMFANGSEKISYLARINNILINTEIFLLANSVAKSELRIFQNIFLLKGEYFVKLF